MTDAAPGPKKTPLWRSIATALTTDISEGRYAPGDKLPTEADLSARFGVNRHTVRRALAELAENGVTRSRRGAGVFVTQAPTDYPIGRKVRFHQNLRAAGRLPTREILSGETRKAAPDEARALDLPEGAPVHVSEGRSLADGQPMALFRSVFPAERFPGLLDVLRQEQSVTRTLARFGVTDYTRIWTRLNARPASATQALNLRLREGEPILRTIGVNADVDGRPVEYGRTWFAGDRVTLTLDPD